MKLTDKKKDVIELVKRTIESGGDYALAAQRLTHLGYKTSRGRVLSQKQVSAFMLKYAKVRLQAKRTRRSRSTTPLTPPGVSVGNATTLQPKYLRYIEDIVTSTLSDEVKLLAIKGVLL